MAEYKGISKLGAKQQQKPKCLPKSQAGSLRLLQTTRNGQACDFPTYTSFPVDFSFSEYIVHGAKPKGYPNLSGGEVIHQ